MSAPGLILFWMTIPPTKKKKNKRALAKKKSVTHVKWLIWGVSVCVCVCKLMRTQRKGKLKEEKN